jgi:hypothetical protein
MPTEENPSMDLVLGNSSMTSEPEAESVDQEAECDICSGCCNNPSGNDFWTRKTLTNGFWGAQPALAEQDILYSASDASLVSRRHHGSVWDALDA